VSDDTTPTTPQGDQPSVGSHGSEIVAAEPIADPGLPAHQWRPTDVDPKAERRAERQVAALFAL
jgi:ubiquinol-cytochrome c reductase iron-sulfur subunit